MALLNANGHIVTAVRLTNGRVILREARSKLKFKPPKKRAEATQNDRENALLRKIRECKIVLGS